MVTMNIRLATTSDATILCQAEQAIAATPGRLVSLPDELQVENFVTMIQKSTTRYIVVEQNNELIGHAFLEQMGLKAVAHIMRLTIAVHEGYQGQGVGKLMMNHLIDWAKSTPSVEKIELHVRATNQAAIALYKNLGFVEEGRIKRRIKISESQYLDDLTMGLQLK
jgi:ribosomal protein S18 acetylase RimI-like enzyme